MQQNIQQNKLTIGGIWKEQKLNKKIDFTKAVKTRHFGNEQIY